MDSSGFNISFLSRPTNSGSELLEAAEKSIESARKIAREEGVPVKFKFQPRHTHTANGISRSMFDTVYDKLKDNQKHIVRNELKDRIESTHGALGEYMSGLPGTKKMESGDYIITIRPDGTLSDKQVGLKMPLQEKPRMLRSEVGIRRQDLN